MKKSDIKKYQANLSTLLAICALTAFAITGCQQKTKIETYQKPLATQQNLEKELEKLKAENTRLKQQLMTIEGLNPEIRLNAITQLSNINITKRTALFDKNKDGKNDSLRLCLRTIDSQGDMIKAPGQLTIQLWNLKADPKKTLLKSWTIKPESLKNAWSGTLMTSYYKFELDLPQISLPPTAEMTITAEFIDYMTGKTLTTQKVIKGNK